MEKQQSKKPFIRFPEFKDAWEHKRLNELLSEAKKRNEDLKYGKDEVLSVSGELGMVNQIEHLGRSYAGASVHNYPVVEVGDVVYTKSPLKENPFGIIKVNKGKAGIVSTLYAVYKVNQQSAYGPFIDYYFSLDANTNRYLRPLVKKGAKNDMKINNAYVLHDRIFAPTIPEQQRIASFFTVLDKKISELKRKKNLLEQYKKGVMQKIFSQEIRFNDEKGKPFPKWETKILKTVFSRISEKNLNNSFVNVLTNSATRGVVNQEDYFDKEIANQNNLLGYYIVDIDDFVYNPRISQSAPVGPLKRNHSIKGVMSPLYTVLRCKTGNLDFFELYFETAFWHKYMKGIANYGVRHDRMNITNDGFEKLPLPYPVIEEQNKIAYFLKDIENKIVAVSSQLEMTKQYKKGLLQKMFI
jgi:type I restriction enzyme S subunit